MLPTMREVLATPLLSAGDPEVLAGEQQLGRPVRWLHPAEISDIAHLLRGDEIVLTTGTFLPADDAALHAYVHSLADAGVTGLVVELGRRWDSAVPDALTAACESANLVLVVLRREVRFAAIVEQVGACILEAEMEDLRAAERIHETFTRLDVNAADSREILAAVVRMANVPVVLESARHQVIEYDTAERDHADVLAEWSRRSRAVRLPGRTGYDYLSGWLMTVVGSRGDDWGRLILLTDRSPSRRDYVLIERAAAALSLHQMRSRARDSAERSAHTTLLAELGTGRVTPELLMRCEAANLPVRQRRFVGIAVRRRFTTGQGKTPSLADLASALTSAARSLAISILIGLDTDHVIALISLESESFDPPMAGLAHELRKLVSVTLARGEMVNRPEEIYRTLFEAKNILAATQSDDDRPWVTLADVHLRGLIHLLRDDERLQLFVRRELAPLIAYDATRGTNLTHLLEVFLQTPGGKAAAAKELLLSRPVLYERLGRIQAILGVDLEDPLIRTSLHVAVLARSIQDQDATASLLFPETDHRQ